MGVTKSNNIKGNPYHSDETGKFVSQEGGNDKVSSENKILSKLGLNPQQERKHEYIKGQIQKIVPQTNMDGSPRVFINGLPYEQKMSYIQNLRDREKNIVKTITDNDKDTFDIKTPEREAFREQSIENEIKKQLNEGEKRYDRKATIILGLPASGKSTLAKYLKADGGSFEIDSDFFTEIIPEFVENPSRISEVHREAGYMSKKMMNKIAKEGGNMIIGKVGGGYDNKYLISFLDDLQKNGYSIDLVYNDIPLEEGIRRNEERHRKGNPRFVPASVSIIADATAFDNFGKLINHPAVVSGSIYSNDVPMGQSPRFIRKIEKEL